MERVDITGLNKARVLQALYAVAKPRGGPNRSFVPGPLSIFSAEDRLRVSLSLLDFKGRIMNVDISGNDFDPQLFDRHNGLGAAAAAIATLKP